MAALQGGKIKTCPQCSAQVKDLQFHLLNVHKINVEGKFLNFKNFEQFKIWKENIERKTVSRYVKHSGGKKRKNGGILIYYYCHRDGSYIPKGRNERSLKMIGSNKINGNCPSLIKVEQNAEGLKVLYIPKHVGHTCDVGRMVFTQSCKGKIAAEEKLKVSLRDLEERKSYLIEHVTKVLGNIKTEAGISAFEKSFLFVEEAIKTAENSEQTFKASSDNERPPKEKSLMFYSTENATEHVNISLGTDTQEELS